MDCKSVIASAGLARLAMTVWLLLYPSMLSAQEKPYDYIIQDALVFDGESLIAVEEDVAITGSRISLMADRIPVQDAKEIIKARGLVLAPGFIDIHTHSDFNPFIYPSLGNKVAQGVTTEVVGNCGMSAAPVLGHHGKEIGAVWRREGVEIPAKIPWKTFREYTDETQLKGLETNFVSLVGHGNLRSAVMEMGTRKATAEEIEQMKLSLGQAMDEGAFGISFGLGYLPGAFAAREELEALCRVAGEKGGMCVFHIRSESSALIESIAEAIEIGKAARAPVHISHLKASGTAHWPKIEQAFQIIEEARNQGLRITADAYPYNAGFAELGAMLPDEYFKAPNRLARLRDPEKRIETLNALEAHYREHPVSWKGIRVASVTKPENFPLRGKSIEEIANERGKSPVETLMGLLAEEEFQVSAFYFSQSKEVARKVLSKHYVAVGSDSIADGSSMPHPRAFGTFPKLLAQCREKGLPGQTPCWGSTIHQMTSLPARIMNLKRRGRVAPGHYADLVIFDPEKITDAADYKNPTSLPRGIDWVFVNGQAAVREGRPTHAHSGLFLTPRE